MRLLLDECVPRPLLRDLAGHDAHHVVDMGWSSKRNGELLTLMVEAQSWRCSRSIRTYRFSRTAEHLELVSWSPWRVRIA